MASIETFAYTGELHEILVVDLFTRDARLCAMIDCRILACARPLTGGEALCVRHRGAHGGLWRCPSR